MYIQRPQVITTYKGPLHICTYNGHKLLQLTNVLSTYVRTAATSYYNLQRSSPHIYIQQPQVITTYKGPLHIFTYNHIFYTPASNNVFIIITFYCKQLAKRKDFWSYITYWVQHFYLYVKVQKGHIRGIRDNNNKKKD